MVKKVTLLLLIMICLGTLTVAGQDMGISVQAGASMGSWMGDAAPDIGLLYGGSVRASLGAFILGYVDVYFENPIYNETYYDSVSGYVLAASVCGAYPLMQDSSGIMRLGGGVSLISETVDYDVKSEYEYIQEDDSISAEVTGFCITADYDFYGNAASLRYIIPMDNPDLSLASISFYIRLL